MLNQKKILISTILLLFLFSCNINSKKTIDFGILESGVYENKFFDLVVEIPETWHAVDDESRIELTKKGIDFIAGDDDNLKATFNAADLESINLLFVSEHLLGAPVPTNPSLIIMAEKVEHLPGIVEGKDYHFHTKKLMESSAISVSYPKDIYGDLLGTEYTFDVLELEIKIGKIKYFQKQYAVIMKGYALVIALTYSNKEELEKLDNILKTIELK